MEAFSLLKYWRGGGAVVGADATAFANSRTTAANTTILAAVAEDRDESDSDSDSESDGDDGPFFDLEFAVPDEDESEPRDPDPVGNSTDDSDSEAQPEDNDDEDEESDEREFNFTVSSGSPRDHTGDPNLTLSPSDDLFFKGKLVPIEPSSIEFNPSEEPNSKPQFAGALLKSATKFRVFMLGLKKPKPNATNSNGSSEKTEKTEPPIVSAEPPLKPPNSPQKTQEPQLKTQAPGQQKQKQKQQGKLFTVKFKVEEVPIVSLFTRDNSSRISTTNKPPQTTAAAQQKPMISASEESASSEEKRFPKEVVQKYLKMVKPLYVRVSKRYGEKLRLSGQLSLSGSHSAPASSPVASAEITQTQPGTEVAAPPSTAGGSGKSGQKPGNFPAGLRVVCKHLGKSRSASSAVAAAPSAAVVSQRRDDSLLQQQDGIQSAILHCKRSFNASRDLDSSLLPRSVSDSSKEKSVEVSSKSLDQGKGVSL